jgi:hypothetical protein
MFFRKSLSFVAVLTFATLAQAAPQRIRHAIDNNQTTVLHGGTSHLARPEFDRGPASPGMRIHGASIVFSRTAAQQADAASFMAELQDPKSPNFHQWITPQQYADRFGMSQADIDKVVGWLRSQGLHVDSVSNSRTQMYFSGTVAQIQTALRTQIHQFAQDNEMHFANIKEPALPAAIAGSVLAVRNLNDFRPKPRKMHVRKIPAPQPRFTSGSSSHFISPDDLAIIYNVKPLYDAGITGAQAVAVVGQTEIAQSDVAAFRTAAGLSANPFQAVLMPNTGASTVVDADVLEADLDVEWSGAVAKNAAILYVYTGNGKRPGSTSGFNVIDAFGYVIDNTLAPVISISYGLCEASAGPDGRDFFQTLASEAVMHGQTISSATGDEGAADCEDSTAGSATHGLAVDLPSAIPEVTGVGGSEFSGDVSSASTYWAGSNTANNASAISYIPESAWNDSTQTIASGDGFSAGGGGLSAFFAKPTWQTGTGVPNDGKRDVPDIALNASAHHDGYLVCSKGNCKNGGFVDTDNTILLVGGTSVGAPVFAGVVGLLNQAAQTNGQGNVNRQLYPLAASTPAAFHDITTGDNKVPCTAGSTGCTSANSHLLAASRVGWFGAAGGLMLVSFVAICVPVRRRRWLAISGPLLIALLAVGIGCGGSSAPSTPSTPTPTPETGVSIGYSAGVGYDMATGLGSIDAHTLVTNWVGVPAAPSFTIVASPASLSAAANQPAVSSLNVSSTTGFAGAIALSCASASGNVQVSCAVAPTSVTLNSGTISASATLTTHAPANTYAILVKGTSGSVVQFEKVTLTSQ